MQAVQHALEKVLHIGGEAKERPQQQQQQQGTMEPPTVAEAAAAGQPPHKRIEETGGLGQDMMGHPLQSNLQYSGGNLGGDVVATPYVTITSNKHPTETMKALVWHGAKDVRIETRPKPMVTDPGDAVLRVTSTAICGSDLHLYLGSMTGLQKGDILGHEFMGIVEEVGPEVQQVKAGDRVVACFDIACGACRACSRQHFSACDSTNPSKDQEVMYGHRSGGFFGYAHLTGGYEGGQAEYVRVPFADVNLLKVPDNLPDEKVVLLSDIMSTAWYSVDNAHVDQDSTVAIWGAGPGGILAAHCALVRGAKSVALIDSVQYRLDHAKAKMPQLHTINFNKEKVKEALEAIMPGGPDVCVEMVGFHYSKTWLHAIEKKAQVEQDPSDIINELIRCCRKGGIISIAGVYVGYTNHFNIGGFMEKGLTMVTGQTPVQKYWYGLLDMVKAGTLDPTLVITHIMPLEDAPRAYKIFNDKTDGCIKVVLKPRAHTTEPAASTTSAAAEAFPATATAAVTS